MRWYDCRLALRPPYVTSSKSRAAVCSRSAREGRARAASAAASSAVRPGRMSRRARSSRERTIARMRSWTAWFQWPWAACASAVARCSAALRGRSSNRVAEEAGSRRGVPRRHHRAPRTAMTARMTTTRPSAPPGVAVAAVLNSLPTQSQKASRARWNQLGSFSWYRRLDSSRRAASRAGSRGMVIGGSPSERDSDSTKVSPARTTAPGIVGSDAGTPRQAHRISLRAWDRRCRSRSPGCLPRGRGRCRGPRGGCAGRCRGAR